MKYFFNLLFFLLFTLGSSAENVPPEIVQRFQTIVSYINDEKIIELSELIVYPIRRENPLPDIATKKEFLAYYSILFDSAFKEKLLTYNDSDIFEHHGDYGLVGGRFNGDIWINPNGEIISINYKSANELILQKKITKQIQSNTFPSVNKWDKNILVCKADSLIIRIDVIGSMIRYVSWNRGQQMSEKPDLVLLNGVEESQGTMGGCTWTFLSGDWTYIIDDVELFDEPKKCGLYLEVLLYDTLKSRVRLEEIK